MLFDGLDFPPQVLQVLLEFGDSFFFGEEAPLETSGRPAPTAMTLPTAVLFPALTAIAAHRFTSFLHY
ncbi:MAG: hypothetical protein ABWK53_13225 [Anaerolineales bacterium]